MKKALWVACLAGGLVGTIARPSHASGVLGPHYYLFRGQFQYEPSRCYYHLEMQDDGNLVTYAGPGTSQPIWSTGTNVASSHPCGTSGDVVAWPAGLGSQGVFAALQTDGNFVVRNGWGDCFWATNVTNYNLPGRLSQQVDGNLVVYDFYGLAKWSSGQVRPWYSAACPSPRGKKTLVTSSNRAGSDYAVVPLVSDKWPLCGDICAHDPNCRAWTYVPPGWAFADAAGCWLKSSIPDTSSMAGVVSGAIFIDP